MLDLAELRATLPAPAAEVGERAVEFENTRQIASDFVEKYGSWIGS